MWKKTLAIGLGIWTLASTAFAEQPKIQEYRNILNSGKYYVEYELGNVEKILAVEDHRRMDYTIYKKGGNLAMAGLGLINPVFALGALIRTQDKVPTALYQYGKFYQFLSKKKAIMAIWNQLDDPNLDPTESWNTVKQKLALPEELAIIAPNEEYNQHLNGETPAKLIESGEALVNGKPQLYDKYITTVVNRKGKIVLEKTYFFYYVKGELNEVKSFIQLANDIERPYRTLKLKKISAEIPENALKIPEGCKVYAAGVGDMNDLIDNPALVEDYTVKEKSEGENNE